MTTKIKCPSCETHLEADGDLRGQRVQCPECGYEFTVPKILRMDAAQPRTAPSAHSAPTPTKGKNAYFGDFLLGLAFNFVGIFIAHMIDGREGAKAALRGMLLEMLAGAILLVSLNNFATANPIP